MEFPHFLSEHVSPRFVCLVTPIAVGYTLGACLLGQPLIGVIQGGSLGVSKLSNAWAPENTVLKIAHFAIHAFLIFGSTYVICHAVGLALTFKAAILFSVLSIVSMGMTSIFLVLFDQKRFWYLQGYSSSEAEAKIDAAKKTAVELQRRLSVLSTTPSSS